MLTPPILYSDAFYFVADSPARPAPRRRPAVDWDLVGRRAAALRDGAGDAVMLVLALGPASAGGALLLAAFGLVRL